ncbi:MAG: HNH endonuclease [Moraxella sp.]|uniref:HNH endonuclease n=1 Tax=Moraxella sp. TaxID=479 RepID=UPI0026DDAF83|nr:HNH endonuclease [Moraxella sp.]MDO4450673.1 HNH endonuclease [Moraxella sp.]
MQIYEDYWELTNEFTDYNGSKFLTVLTLCINFIDECKKQPTLQYSAELYKTLQELISQHPEMVSTKTGEPKNLASVRKSINQLVKMGFIEPFLEGYTPLSRDYVNARTNKKRQTLLSKIVYTHSAFGRSVTEHSDIRQMNFLIKTLVEHPEGKLNKSEIAALMLVDLENYPNDHLSKTELDTYLQQGIQSGFIERKYNQISYLWNLLAKLDNLKRVNDDLYFAEDAERIFGNLDDYLAKKRDPYLHRLYKNQLFEESEFYYGGRKCMLEKLSYPVLIASHIKPFIQSNDNEAYDPNNGLLLSRTLDSLFDLKYISFDDNGNMLKSKRLSDDVWQYWKHIKLDAVLLNDERKRYLAEHRNLLAQKDDGVI